jgi:Mg2+ and Co2+ transporter CorA
VLWAYTISKSNEVLARDVTSEQELDSIKKEVDWLWLDIMEPNDDEYRIIAGLIEETRVLSHIKAKKTFSRPERVDSFLLFSISHAVFNGGLKTFPIYVFLKENTILTVRNKNSEKSIKNALKTFEDCVGRVCEGPVNSSFVLSRLFHEVSNDNLDVVLAIRERIDKLEQKALENPADKSLSHSVFSVKRSVSAVERILWSQMELMLSIREGVVLMVEKTPQIMATLSHSISNISRELSILNSHTNALDSVLSVQDLGMIHRVERNLLYITFMAFIMSVILILLEIDFFNLLSV